MIHFSVFRLIVFILQIVGFINAICDAGKPRKPYTAIDLAALFFITIFICFGLALNW